MASIVVQSDTDPNARIFIEPTYPDSDDWEGRCPYAGCDFTVSEAGTRYNTLNDAVESAGWHLDFNHGNDDMARELKAANETISDLQALIIASMAKRGIVGTVCANCPRIAVGRELCATCAGDDPLQDHDLIDPEACQEGSCTCNE